MLGRLVLAYAIGFAPVTSCAASDRVYTVRGIVRAPFQDGTISIQHEEIPGFMPAMTMPFYVDATEAKQLSAGDRVEFEFHVGERSRATKFRKVGRVEANPRQSAAREATATPSRKRLREGDPLPAFTLTDQDNRAITDADLRGRNTILTFVFTRCPVPEFCPLIGKKYQALQSALSMRAGLPTSEVQLLSISIDPEHDKPAVLRAYGESLGADFSRWRFATGTSEEIEKLTRAFAVRTERNGASLDHTLATALISPDGKVTDIWRGNAWKPEEVVSRITGAPRQ
jgi:protein SCO1/2